MPVTMEQMSAADALVTAPTTMWQPRLAFDTALMLELGEDNTDSLLERYNIDALSYARIAKDPVFLRQVENFRTEIKDKGVTFRMKARLQAEELLQTSWMLIHNPDVSPVVKADLIKSTVKWAGLEPKGEPIDTGGTGGVAITINLGDKKVEAIARPADVVDNEKEE